MLETVKVLVNIAKTLPPSTTSDDTFMMIKNEKGNTALHEAVIQEIQEVAFTDLPEAVMQERHKVAYWLIQADHEAAYCVNEEGKSPLYLATELGNKNMLTLLLEEIATDGDGYAVLEKLKGEKSPVDAALLHENSGMLKEISIKKPELLHYIDKEGKSPFHYAASIGSVEGIKFLLKAKEDGALVRDNNGFYPIHEACKNGHVDVVRLLLELWSDPGEFLTNKGQNIFHVAAESGEETVVRYLLHAQKLADFVVEMVNQKDKEGNTPLHLATLHARSIVVFRLVREKNVDNKLKNGANLTAYDLAVEQSTIVDLGSSEKSKLEAMGKATGSELQGRKTLMVDDHQKKSNLSGWKLRESYERMMTLSILQYAAHAPLSDKLRVQPRPPSKEDVSASINSLIVVATLVAGATFAASVAIPGGDSEKETKNYRYAFLIFNTMAMNMAIIAAIILCWAQQGDINIASLAAWGVSWIVGGSLYMLCFAFLSAVLIAVSKYTTFAWIVVVIEGVYIVFHTVLLVPLVMPSRIKQMLIRLFYLVLFSVYYIVVRLGKRSALGGKKSTSNP
ncbi:protein ACCELERATED CELL DEATH 6-like isoform X2 [Tripterygium wilfordii]|nr:protein ACCELERATED CELL DEATH 6-like isoform X2 [Tripterygium wilfordii]